MFDRKNFTYILTILEAIEKIYLYTDEFADPEEFFEANDQLQFNGCQILLLVIGEESKKIDNELKEKASHIPWPLISRLRNRIAHEYRSIDPYISFDIIQNYLPELKEALIELLAFVEFDRELLEKALSSSFYKNLQFLRKLDKP